MKEIKKIVLIMCLSLVMGCSYKPEEKRFEFSFLKTINRDSETENIEYTPKEEPKTDPIQEEKVKEPIQEDGGWFWN